MRALKLKILAKDILETDFINQNDCAITRAIKRTGLSYYDTGAGIYSNHSKKLIITNENKYYTALLEKVIKMYLYKDTETIFYDLVPERIEDFEIEIKF